MTTIHSGESDFITGIYTHIGSLIVWNIVCGKKKWFYLFVHFACHARAPANALERGVMWQVGQNCLTCHIAPLRRGVRNVLLWPVNCRKPSASPRRGNATACPTSLLPGRMPPPAPQAFPHLMIPFTSSYTSPHRRHICFGELLKRLRKVRASLRRSWVLRVRIVFIWNSSMQISFRCWRIS